MARRDLSKRMSSVDLRTYGYTHKTTTLLETAKKANLVLSLELDSQQMGKVEIYVPRKENARSAG